MASVRIGGDPESYMDPPQMTVGGGGKGGGGLIASVLDALGIGRQVAKEPKGDTGGNAANVQSPTGTTQSVPPPKADLPVLNDAESAFKPIQPMPSDWGQRYLESLKPLKTIDPNTAL